MGQLESSKQLVSPGCDSQQLFQLDGNTFIDGHGADFASLALDSDTELCEAQHNSVYLNKAIMLIMGTKMA